MLAAPPWRIDGALRARPTETGASSRSRMRNPLVDVSLTVCTARIVGARARARPTIDRGPGDRRAGGVSGASAPPSGRTGWRRRPEGRRVELPVGRCHVHCDPFAVAQVGEGAEVDVPSRVGRRHAAVEPLTGLPVHVLQVGLHRRGPAASVSGPWPGTMASSSMSEQQVAGPNPVGERSGPHDRGAGHEAGCRPCNRSGGRAGGPARRRRCARAPPRSAPPAGPAASSSMRPENVVVGSVGVMPSKSKGPKHSRT